MLHLDSQCIHRAVRRKVAVIDFARWVAVSELFEQMQIVRRNGETGSSETSSQVAAAVFMWISSKNSNFWHNGI